MYVDPGDYLRLMGVDATQLRDDELDSRARIARMEKTLEAVSEEIERLGEVQRFALKVIADKVSDAAEPQEPIRLSQGRVITPH